MTRTHHPRRRVARSLRLAALVVALGAAQGAAPGCLRVEHGIEVELALSWVAAEPGAALPLGDGSTVRLDDGLAWVEGASLLRCVEDHASLEPRALLRALWPVAHAQHDHGGGGTSVAGPLALSPHDRGVVLGRFTPPPGRYCGVHVVLASEDGPTLVATGSTDAGEAFSAWSDEDGYAHLTLETPLVLEVPGLATLDATLFGASPFAGLERLPGDARALGDHLVGGRAHGALHVSSQPGQALAGE
jgi:hypothetical protein